MGEIDIYGVFVPGLLVWHWIESRYLLRRADTMIGGA